MLDKKIISNFFILLSIISFSVVTNARLGMGGNRIGEFGFFNFIRDVFELDFIRIDTIKNLLYSSFNGFFNIASTIENHYYYPISYKVISFSPFPSIIDGFSKIRHFEQRVSTFGPFNSISESYHFGFLYFTTFITLTLLAIKLTDKIRVSFGDKISLIVSASLFFSLIQMNTYPIKHVSRWLILSILLSMAITCIWKNKTK